MNVEYFSAINISSHYECTGHTTKENVMRTCPHELVFLHMFAMAVLHNEFNFSLRDT